MLGFMSRKLEKFFNPHKTRFFGKMQGGRFLAHFCREEHTWRTYIRLLTSVFRVDLWSLEKDVHTPNFLPPTTVFQVGG